MDLEFVTIPKNTCFLSGIDTSNLTKDDIWLSYYGFENISNNNINRAINFSKRYGEACGIAFFKNKSELKLLYIPYANMYLENNNSVKNKAIQTLRSLIKFVEESNISINKTKNSMKLALYEVFLNDDNSSEYKLERDSLRGKLNINIKTNGIPNPDLLASKIVKEFGKENKFDGWIRKSNKNRITQGDEIYLFNRHNLLLDCDNFCKKGTRKEKKFCEAGCKYAI